jgi:hypothetical protein
MVKKVTRKPGPPARYGRRPTLTVRLQMPLYRVIKKVAAEHGKSISEEIEGRVQASVGLETERAEVAKDRAEVEKLHANAWATLAKANDLLEANRIQALRLAGHRILREIDGTATRALVLPIGKLEAEAEAMMRSEAIKQSVGGFEPWQPGEMEAALETAAAMRQAVGITDEEVERRNAEKLRRANVGPAWDVGAALDNLDKIAEASSAAAAPKKDDAA